MVRPIITSTDLMTMGKTIKGANIGASFIPTNGVKVPEALRGTKREFVEKLMMGIHPEISMKDAKKAPALEFEEAMDVFVRS